MKVFEYCKCGASLTGRIEPDRSAARVIEKFWIDHQGDGHGKCGSNTCYRNRAKNDSP